MHNSMPFECVTLFMPVVLYTLHLIGSNPWRNFVYIGAWHTRRSYGPVYKRPNVTERVRRFAADGSCPTSKHIDILQGQKNYELYVCLSAHNLNTYHPSRIKFPQMLSPGIQPCQRVPENSRKRSCLPAEQCHQIQVSHGEYESPQNQAQPLNRPKFIARISPHNCRHLQFIFQDIQLLFREAEQMFRLQALCLSCTTVWRVESIIGHDRWRYCQ